MPYIQLKNLNKTFGKNHVLKNISMDIEKGQFVTLLGPSGCGKSTLLRCVAGLEDVTSGAILLGGEDITHKSAKNRKIGMVFQQYSLFPNMNVYDNIAFGLRMKKIDKKEIEKKARDAIAMVGLEGKENEYPSHLSGGQQQRVALARSIVTEPKVLLLDEPLSAIDAKLRKSLQSEIKKIQSQLGITTIFVTHDQNEAMVMSDIIHLFNNGTIEQSGSPVSMYTSPSTKFAASFIGHYNILTMEEFSMLVGCDFEKMPEKLIAIRPEVLDISLKPFDLDGKTYQFTGIIVDNIPHGNVLRYTIDVNGVKLRSDVLFRSFRLFENGTPVYLCVEKRNCLILSDNSAAEIVSSGCRNLASATEGF